MDENQPKPIDPKEIRVGNAEIAYLFDCAEQRASQIIREKGFKKDEAGKVNLFESVRDYVRSLRTKIGGADKTGSGKKDQVTLQNEKLKLDLDERRGKLIPVAMVEKEWATKVVNFKQRMLAIPSKFAPELANETEPKVVQSILENGIREALFELASTEGDRPKDIPKKPSKPDNEGGGNVAATPVAESVGVVRPEA